MVGYSRLMGEDEAGTLDALRAHRAAVIEPKTAQYKGRVVKLMGDGTLLEFGSVVNASAPGGTADENPKERKFNCECRLSEVVRA